MSRITWPAKRTHARHPRLSPRRLEELIEQAIVDAYGPAEQAVGLPSARINIWPQPRELSPAMKRRRHPEPISSTGFGRDLRGGRRVVSQFLRDVMLQDLEEVKRSAFARRSLRSRPRRDSLRQSMTRSMNLGWRSQPSRSCERSERLAKAGWEAGIRTPITWSRER